MIRRRAPLRRKAPLRRGARRVGAAARERVRAGGKLAVGRPSVTHAEWRATVERVLERANARCERCGSRRAVDPHHVVKRSQGGADDPDAVVALCRWVCHRLCDVSFRDGRLIPLALGDGRFCFRRVWATHKGAPPWRVEHEHTPTNAWLGSLGRPTPPRREEREDQCPTMTA